MTKRIIHVLIVCILLVVRLVSATTPSRAPSRVPSAAPSRIPTFTPTVAPRAQWIADSVNVTTQSTTANAKIDYYIDINSNSLLFDDEVGNYRLNFKYKNRHGLTYVAQTGCIKGTAKGVTLQKTINNLNLYYLDSNNVTQVDPTGPVKTMQSIYTIKVKNYFNPYNHTINYQYQLHMEFYSKQRLNETLTISLSHEECAPFRTIGQWDDPYRWDTQQVPSVLTEVTIPADAGVIKLSKDVRVASLSMLGGHILGYDTYCPFGWSVEPGASSGIKCYQLHETPVSFNEAERTCHAVKGLGSESRHLVHIRNRAELLVAQRMCRGLTGSAAHSKGCWIGLWDQNGSGDFRWISNVAVGTPSDPSEDVGMFLDWRRDEPNNHTISEGRETPGGERCAALVPWQEDPLLLEQGSWNDDSCTVARPFVCQIFGNTARYTLAVQGHTTLTAGRLEGGVISTGAGVTDIAHFTTFRSGRIHVSTGGASCALGKVILQDGASLEIHSNAHTVDDAYLGEPVNSTLSAVSLDPLGPSFQSMQSNVHVAAGATLSLGTGAMYQNVTINARAFVDGTLHVAANTDVYLFQGADMSKSTVTVAAESSQVHLSGYNSRLSTYDAYELQVSHRGEVNGEFYRDFDREEANMHLSNTTGVYRLRVGSDATRCIPYNATADELTRILNALPSVTQRSGVTVRRYGSPSDPRFRFGYTYRIETDSVRTQYYAQGPLSMAIHCYGFDNGCGCAETKVVLVDATGMPQCPASSTATQRSPLSDPNACVVAPTLGVSVISSLAHTQASGAGSIVVEEGVHRFPPVSTCTLAVTAGTGVVASDTITWSGISVTGAGRLVVAGTSWASWDSTYALYAPEWTSKRGELRSLNTASPFLMAVNKFYLSGLGTVLSSCPSSNMTWNSGTWDGGIIGGRSTLNIMQALNATGTTKSLRYGMTLFINEAATVKWTSGNISLADGADFTVEGQLVIDNSDGAAELFIGMAQLLEAPASDPTGAVLLSQDPGRDWHGYYGDELTAELRGGWYQNPLCGDQCLATNHLTIRAAGGVVCRDNTKVTFSLPLDLVGESTLTIQSNVDITMASGGICGNQVVIDISSGTKLELSGGRMLMEATCTIQGQGDLLVTGGSHDLSFSIDARITIEGGTMVWPDTRGDGQNIKFNGGLIMQKTGALIVFPFSTNIEIFGNVSLRDESLIQFPLIGVAAQASLFDEQDAPDPAPRGILTSYKTMRWEGGTLRGKADFKAVEELYLDGGVKYIKSLAKLVNQGHCEWGSGDLISSDSGDFLNLGTVQMKSGVRGFASNAMYQGTELPVESGGDVFALEYHSWDMDNGGLDYTQYVEERTRFVSRAPNGWTVEEQQAAEGLQI